MNTFQDIRNFFTNRNQSELGSIANTLGGRLGNAIKRNQSLLNTINNETDIVLTTHIKCDHDKWFYADYDDKYSP